MSYENIPQELKDMEQWIFWKLVEKTDQKGNMKYDKVPCNKNGKSKGATDTSIWMSFDKALEDLQDNAKVNGIGFVFTENDPYTGIDLDRLIHNGTISPEARQIIDTFNSYTEYSQSGRGLHIIIRGEKPGSKCRKDQLEVYDKDRFFVFTGNHVEGTPTEIKERQEQLEAFYSDLIEPNSTTDQPTTLHESCVTLQQSADVTVDQIIAAASSAQNNKKFDQLFYDGDISGYESHSEADQALCSLIAFYCQDPEGIDEIFRESALCRDKWIDREDYRERTITTALAGLTATFSGTFPEEPEELPAAPAILSVADYLDETFFDTLRIQGELEDISTGLDSLDETLGGGLYPGLYVFGAVSSLGKTALCGQIADIIAYNGHFPVLFFSLEMSQFEMVCRNLTRLLFLKNEDHCNTNTGHLLHNRVPHADLMPIVQEYREDFAPNIAFVEGNFETDVSTIRKNVKEYIADTGRHPVVFLDYLQILKPLREGFSEKQAIDASIVELKRISRDYSIPVIVVSSFNRSSYKHPVSFTAFKESGAIEYTADVVIGLELRGAQAENADINELKSQNPRDIDLVILKNRRGPAYEKIELDYYPGQNYFVESTEEE